jgi:Phage Tail Collar Domain
MGLEAATYIDDLNSANPSGGDAKYEGDNHLRLIKATLKTTLPGLVGRAWRSQTKSSGYTVVANDNMSTLNCTGALTLDLTAAATLGNGHMFFVHANGGDVVIDPDAAELVNGVATATVPNGTIALVRCDGTGFVTSIMETTTGTLSPTQITASQNDYAPAGHARVNTLRLSTDARWNLTGLAGGLSDRLVTVHNVGDFPLVFKRESGSSTAANRFAFGHTLGGGQTAVIRYDGTSARWRAVSLPEPIGTIKDFGMSTMPEGYLALGTSELRTDYPALFNEIGTVWGAVDGTHFNLPPSGRGRLGAGTPSLVEICTASSGNGFVVAANTRKWFTGTPVVLSSLSGFTTSASAGPTYYVVRISSTNIRLATTLALAQNLTPDVTVSGAGSVTLTVAGEARTFGEVGGEEGHAASITESLPHTLTINGHGFGAEAPATTAAIWGSGSLGTNGPFTSGNTSGGNAAMNIMSPFKVVTEGIRYC